MLQKHYTHAYKDLSYVHEQLGRYDEAITVRRRGLKMFPEEPYFQGPNMVLSDQTLQ